MRIEDDVIFLGKHVSYITQQAEDYPEILAEFEDELLDAYHELDRIINYLGINR